MVATLVWDTYFIGFAAPTNIDDCAKKRARGKKCDDNNSNSNRNSNHNSNRNGNQNNNSQNNNSNSNVNRPNYNN